MSTVTQKIQDQVASLYIAFFGRAPDAQGFGGWAQEMAAGASPFKIAADFALSPEWTSQYSGLLPTQQINRFYQNTFGRQADEEGLEYWLEEIEGGIPFSTVAFQIIWAAYLGGDTVDPDDAALVQNKVDVALYFAIELASNDTDIAETAFVGVKQDPATVTAAEARLAAAVNPPETFTLTTSLDNFVGLATDTVFNGIVDFGGGRAPGAASTLNLNDTIDGGAGTNTLNLTIQNAGASVGAVTAVNQVNQIAFASLAASAADNSLQLTFGSTQVTLLVASEALQYDVAVQVEQAIDSLFGANIASVGTGVGASFVATTASATGAHTVQISDDSAFGAALALNVKGVTGISNTVVSAFKEGVTASSALTITPTATLNTEIVNLMNTSGQNVSADAGKFGGAEQIWNVSSAATGDITLTNVAVGTALGIKGAGDITAEFKAGSATAPLTTGAIALALNGAGSSSADSTFAIASGSNNTFTTLNIASGGTTNFIALDGAAINSVKTVNVSGAGKLDVQGTDATDLDNVTIVNASSNTGGVTVALRGNEKDVTITGGSGNDVFDMDNHLTKLDVINGGGGVNTVRVIDVALTDLANTAQKSVIDGINATTNIQTLGMNGATATLDASKITKLSSFAFSSAGAVAVIGLTNSNTITILNAVTGAASTAGTDALNFAALADSGSNLLTLSVKGNITGGASTSGAAGDGLDAAQFETVNISVAANTAFAGGATTAGGAAGKSVIVADNATITATGGKFSLDLGTIVGLNTTVDASKLGGALSVTGDAGDNLITGGAGNDVINGADGRDTISLGAGGIDTVTLATAAASRDVITGFTAGTDSNTADQLKVGTYTGLTEFKVTAVSYTWGDDKVIEYSFEAANNSADLSKAIDGTELFKAIANQGSSATVAVVGASDKGYLTAYQGGKAFIYFWDADAAVSDTAITAAEVVLVATVDGISTGAFVAGNFIA